MTDHALLEQIADQAETVRRCQRAYYGYHGDPARKRVLLQDSLAAEKTLDGLLARRAGVP